MRLKERMQQFMIGRYGTDDFNRFLLIISFVLLILSLFGGRNMLYTLALALLIYCYFRMFSRNTYKRAAENEKYCELKNRFFGFFRREKEKLRSTVRSVIPILLKRAEVFYVWIHYCK